MLSPWIYGVPAGLPDRPECAYPECRDAFVYADLLGGHRPTQTGAMLSTTMQRPLSLLMLIEAEAMVLMVLMLLL